MTRDRWEVRVMPVPDRSGYRFPPYWYPDDPLPLDLDTTDSAISYLAGPSVPPTYWSRS